MRAVPVIVTLALAACSPRVDPAPEQTAGVAAAPAVPADPTSLSERRDTAAYTWPGEYRVAGVDGSAIDQPYAITAAITETGIHVTSDCLSFAWTYATEGDRITTRREAAEGCGRGLTAAEASVVAGVDAATVVARTPANAVELRGSGHTVVLFSQ